MIMKLENAGLGFYVRSAETQDKLGTCICSSIIKTEYYIHEFYILPNSGRLPLRQLVYRVFDLPPSMRPLVYDFGQLNSTTEESYVHQIVTNYVSN